MSVYRLKRSSRPRARSTWSRSTRCLDAIDSINKRWKSSEFDEWCRRTTEMNDESRWFAEIRKNCTEGMLMIAPVRMGAEQPDRAALCRHRSDSLRFAKREMESEPQKYPEMNITIGNLFPKWLAKSPRDRQSDLMAHAINYRKSTECCRLIEFQANCLVY